MNIGIDLDDVLAEFAASFIPYINDKYSTSFEFDEFTKYNSWEVMGLSFEEFHKRVHEFYDSDEFEFITPESEACKSIQKLSADHTLFVITSRPDSTLERTRQWVEKHTPQIETILHSNQFSLDDKNKVPKSKLCKDNDIKLFIDDAPKYIDEVSSAGIKSMLYDKPWNQEYSFPKNVRRVESWDEISEIIRN